MLSVSARAAGPLEVSSVLVPVVVEIRGRDAEDFCLDLLCRQHSGLQHEALQRCEPALVVLVALAFRVFSFPDCDLVDQAAAERLPVELLLLDEADGHAERACLPGRFEDELAVGAR